MYHTGRFSELTFSLHDTKESNKILFHMFCVKRRIFYGMCTEEVIRSCETYEICEYPSFFIIILIKFAIHLTSTMETLHAAFLPFKQYAVYLLSLSSSPPKCTNKMPSYCPLLSKIYITIGNLLKKIRYLFYFFKRQRMVM